MIQNPSIQGALRDAANNDVWELVGSGAPTSGASGTGNSLAGKGSNYTDYTNGVFYTNTGTKASPTWTAAITTTGTQTLTNKTLASPIITGATSTTGTFTTPTITTPIFTDYKVLAASATFQTNTVAATLTGFAFTVVPGSYIFEINIPATMTTNGGLTVSYLLTTAVLASLQAQTYAATATDNATAVSTQVTATASATKLFDSKTAAYTLASIKGSFVVGTGGTVTIQACQNTSNSDTTTVLLGAYAKFERVS